MKAKLTLIFILGSFLFAAWAAYDFMFVPVDSEDKTELIFEVQPGESFKKVANNLVSEGILKEEVALYYYGRLTGYGNKVKVGEYRLYKSLRPDDVLQIITSGKSIERSFVVQEGLNIYEIATQFEQAGLGKADEFLALCSNRALIKENLQLNVATLEGFLFPDTYKITKYMGARELIKKMINRFKEVTKDIKTRVNVQFSTIEWVTLSSIIEKETGAPEERPLVASVIFNRLKKKMRLQMDTTTIYGKWRKTGVVVKNISKADLSEKNEYNTYTFLGLPLGPIGNPGRESLMAALNPANSKYLFFVSHNDGTHEFSESLTAHNKSVSKFQVDKKARQGKSWRDRTKKKSKKRRQ
ncbi:MAG: endolytic transglycosylase MltG [Pseudomonadota bacterium]|nr:endolytic transglycosylase MltG [Pseudomonadota bacterium]